MLVILRFTTWQGYQFTDYLQDLTIFIIFTNVGLPQSSRFTVDYVERPILILQALPSPAASPAVIDIVLGIGTVIILITTKTR